MSGILKNSQKFSALLHVLCEITAELTLRMCICRVEKEHEEEQRGQDGDEEMCEILKSHHATKFTM